MALESSERLQDGHTLQGLNFEAPVFTGKGAWKIPVTVKLKDTPEGVASSVEITVNPKDGVSETWEFDCIP